MSYRPKERPISASARFDLKMDSGEKALVAKAAALMATTMTGFVRGSAGGWLDQQVLG